MTKKKAKSTKRVRAKKTAKEKAKEQERMKEEGELQIARELLQPELNAAYTIHAVSPKLAETGEKYTTIPAFCEELKKLTADVAAGGTDHLERVAVSQITTLDTLFTNLVQAGWKNYKNPHFEHLMKLALRAQSQCARTMETLATLKNPAIIARQLNMANQQVVNNAPTLASPPPAPDAPEPKAEAPKALPQKDPEIVRFARTKNPAPGTHDLD